MVQCVCVCVCVCVLFFIIIELIFCDLSVCYRINGCGYVIVYCKYLFPVVSLAVLCAMFQKCPPLSRCPVFDTLLV